MWGLQPEEIVEKQGRMGGDQAELIAKCFDDASNEYALTHNHLGHQVAYDTVTGTSEGMHWTPLRIRVSQSRPRKLPLPGSESTGIQRLHPPPDGAQPRRARWTLFGHSGLDSASDRLGPRREIDQNPDLSRVL